MDSHLCSGQLWVDEGLFLPAIPAPSVPGFWEGGRGDAGRHCPPTPPPWNRHLHVMLTTVFSSKGLAWGTSQELPDNGTHAKGTDAHICWRGGGVPA